MANKNTIREALALQALEDVDELLTRLENANNDTRDLLDSLPAYFEAAGNDLADTLKHGVISDIDAANKRLIKVDKQVSENIELLRRLAVENKDYNEKFSKHNYTNLFTVLIAAMIGSFIGVLIGFIIL